MALTGINPEETFEFVSKNEPTPDNPTIFKIGIIDALTVAKIEDGLTVFTIDPNNPEAKTDTKLSTGKREIELVKAGLKGWSNFLDKEGKEIPFEMTTNRASGKAIDVPKESTLKRIPLAVFKEIANAVYGQNKLSDEERKNSE